MLQPACLLSLIILAVYFPALPAPARAQPVHSVSAVSRGIKLMLTIPRRVYLQDATMRVTASVLDISRHEEQ
jgi:hypothetical protein